MDLGIFNKNNHERHFLCLNHQGIHSFSDYENFARSWEQTHTFIIKTPCSDVALDWLKKIRKDSAHHNKPIFLMEHYGPEAEALSDGVITTIEEAKEKAHRINTLLATLPAIDPENITQDMQLLRFLYGRPYDALVPVGQWQRQSIYFYPLAEVFSVEPGHTEKWLYHLMNRGLLTTETLVDRLHCCPHCNSGHMNYVNICPHCRHMDIEETPFIHCFTCGFVSSQDDFLTNDRLICPRCITKLRHIGSDYDRPMDKYQCHHCKQSFIEPEMLAKCLVCHSHCDPEALNQRNIHRLTITEQGKLSAQSNTLYETLQLLDNIHYAVPEYFQAQLDWMIKLKIRYPNTAFSLIGLAINHIEMMENAIGAVATQQLITACAERIRCAIRETDLTTRLESNRIFFLLPNIHENEHHSFLNRISNIAKDTKQASGISLEFRLVQTTSNDIDPTVENSQSLLAKLNGELD
ncbi:MAG: TackOD1 domain-containing metal-binding protein [Gammaproteobacteria bacterium]